MSDKRKTLLEYCNENNLIYILNEWDYSKNNEINIDKVSYGSNKRVWWICEKGHSYDATIKHRTKKNSPTGCPYCTNQKVLKGYNDLATTHPKVASKWHPTKNADITPYNVVACSNKKVWWICDKGHASECSISHKVRSETNCPYCYNRYPIVGETDLNTMYPEVAKEWHPTKNGNVTPSNVTAGSPKKVWWLCKKGHSWETEVRVRVKGHECPYCTGVKVITGENDLATTHPYILSEWDYKKNIDIKPEEVSYASNKKVWWICDKGHSWEAVVANRVVGSETYCPYCTNRKLLKGFNDLETVNPKLASQWNYKKNGELKPSDILPSVSQKVWWICDKGHEWFVSPNSRNSCNSGCPECNNESKTSFPEASVYYYVSKIFLNTRWRTREVFNKEIDIYIPSIKLGIEYDGYFWHKDRHNKDIEKTLELLTKINLIRIREKGLNIIDVENCKNIERLDNKLNSLNSAIIEILSYIKDNFELTEKELDILNSITVDVKKDNFDINMLINKSNKLNSVESKYPDLVLGWNYEKNGSITPSNMSYGSNKEVWWICKEGHEWKDTVGHRGKEGRNCPYCNNRKVWAGFNDLKSKYPIISELWDYSKNQELTPENVYYNSTKIVWWKCNNCNKSYKRAISNQVKKSIRCPLCKHKFNTDRIS